MTAVEALMQAELLDSSYSGKVGTGNDFGCVHVVRVSGEKVKLSVRWNSYDFQSVAKAELLTPEKAWTLLCTEPGEGWHKSVPVYPRHEQDEAKLHAALDAVAARLLVRARNILA